MTSNQHLRHLTFNETFESSLMENTSEKFNIDKSLLIGIRQNDPNKIIDKNEGSADVNNEEAFDEYGELKYIALGIRKQYDEARTEAMIYEQAISKLKKQKILLQDEEAQLSENAQKQKYELDETNRILNEVTALMDSTIFQKDIYTNVKGTAKLDLLVLKKRCFEADVKLMRENTKLKNVRIDHKSKLKLSKRCKEMVFSVEKNLQTNTLERTFKIESCYETLDRKKNHAYSKESRERFLSESMNEAINDKNPEEKEWNKILTCNLFLKQVLRAKMEKLMKRYMPLEISFHKMRQSTSIKNCNEFIAKFLNKEEAYGELLGSIAEKERHLEILKEEKVKLEKVHRNLTYEHSEIEENKSSVLIGNKTADSHLAKLHSQLIEISKKQQQMYQFGVRFLSVFYSHNNRDQIIESFPKTHKKEIFIKVLQEVCNFVNKESSNNVCIEETENFEKKVESAFYESSPEKIQLTEAIIHKNTRITTNSTIENEVSDTFEEKDMAYDDHSEADFIQYNRRLIKKNDINLRKYRIKSKTSC